MSKNIRVELDFGNSMTAKITMPNGKKFVITEAYITTPTRTVPNPSNDLVEELQRFVRRVADGDKDVMAEMQEAIRMAWDLAISTQFDEEGNPYVLWEATVEINPQTGENWLV